MIITYNGKQSFKLQTGDTILALDPISKESTSKIKPAKFGADAVLMSVQHSDYNGVDMVTYGDKVPFVLDGPGNYEVLGNFVQGILTETTLAKKKYINTVYHFEFDGIKVLFLGHLSSKEIPTSVREAVEEVDIVFIAISEDTLDPSDAHKVAVSFNPKIIIPMDYDKKSLTQFIKEGGDEGAKSQDKLTIKPKDLAGREGDIVALSF